MHRITCGEVRSWVERMVQGEPVEQPDAELYAHIAECATCRGALLLLVVQALQLSPTTLSITCDECLVDLAAFIDAEEASPVQALRDYPQVWWHLWNCELCAEMYQATRAALAQDQQNVPVLPLLSPLSASQSSVLGMFNLPRTFLNIALPTAPSRSAVMRGASAEETVLATQETGLGAPISLRVKQQPDVLWDVIVKASPPAAVAVVTLGADTFQSRFTSEGYAVVTGIPARILSEPDGPDLIVMIMANDEVA